MAPEVFTVNYLTVAIAAIVGFVGMAIMFGASYLLSPKKKAARKVLHKQWGILRAR